MKSLPVDLRSPDLPPRWAWVGLAVLALAAVLVVVASLISQRRLGTLHATHAALRAQAATPPHPVLQRPVVPVMPYDASARMALAQAQADWPSLLAALEAVEVAGVTPISIDVSVPDRQVKVEIEFADFARVLHFLDELNAGEAIPRWQLVQAQAPARALGASPVPGAMSSAVVRGAW